MAGPEINPRELMGVYALGKCSAEELDAMEAYMEDHPEELPALEAVADDRLLGFLRGAGKDTLCGDSETPFRAGRLGGDSATQVQDLPQQLWRLYRSGERPDVATFLAQAGSVTPVQLAAILVVDQRERWQAGDPVPCETYLHEYPQLWDHPEAALDLVCNELLLREQKGETLALQDYQEKLPQLAADLEQRLAWHRARAAEAADLAAEVPAGLRAHPRYRVLRRLGAGGMGTVYLAEHRLMHRLVALKLINPDYVTSPRSVERFRREIAAAAQLHHPNIVAAHDAEEVAGVHFLAMEYAEGESLKDYLERKHPLAVAEACDCVRQAALGLQHAHERGMVHRDIKPPNLMRTPEGRVMILDFGLAVLASQGPSGDLTGSGAIMGTPDYMAPEQTQDAHAADIRADIYALGCTLYQLLSGRVPFPGRSHLDKLIAHRQEEVPPLETLRPDVPREVADITRRMMAKSPDERYQSPQEVADALTAFLTGAPASPTVRQDTRRSSRKTLVAVTLAAALIAAAWGVFTFRNQQGDQFTIVTDDKSIEILVKNRGAELVLFDPITKQTWKIDTEKYRLSDADRPEGLTIELPSKESITLRRKGERVATVTRTKAGPSSPAGTAAEIEVPSDVPELKLLQKVYWPARYTYRTVLSPNGEYFATGGDVGNKPEGEGVRVWATATGTEALTAPGAACMAFSANSRLLYALTYNDRVIRCWDLSTKKQVYQLKGHSNDVYDLALTPDGKTLISSSADKTVRFWDLATKEPIAMLKVPGSAPFLSMTGDGKSVMIYDHYGADRVFRLVDVASRKITRTWTNPEGTVIGVLKISADGREFVSVQSKHLYCWHVDQDKPVRDIMPPPTFGGQALSPDAKWLLYADAEYARLLNLETRKIHGQYKMQSSSIGTHEFSPDGRLAVFCDMSRSVTYVLEMPRETWLKERP